jgi:tricorn protease
MKKSIAGVCFGLLFLWAAGSARAGETLLLRDPDISADLVVFVYGGDLWTAPRKGGAAQRLTSHPGLESGPVFSPDGSWVAFTGQYDGNTDVFAVPAAGGEPRRLTYQAGADTARSWTPDGLEVVFASGRDSAPSPFNRLWTVPLEGGFPAPLPLPMANRGVFSPDGKRLAYVRVPEAFNAWRHYRGGRTTEVWLFDMQSHDVEKVPRDNSNDTNPLWLGGKVYFLSDRNHTMNLFAYDTGTKKIEQLTDHDDYDIKQAGAGGGMVVYEQAGRLHLFDPATGKAAPISITIAGDLPGRRPYFADVSRLIDSYNLSPTGKRAVFSARGDIFTVPAEKGDPRNLTSSSGANDRFPAWSPDGTSIAWFSDESGEYRLRIGDQMGEKPAREIELPNPAFYFNPVWSPDSKKILFADNHLNLWCLDLESGRTVKIDKDTYDHPYRSLDYTWSPDSRWVAYSKRLDNLMHAVFVYSLDKAESRPLTDGLSDAVSPVFDPKGKYLYFLAGTDFALNTGWLDMSSYQRPYTRGIYLAVLSAEDPSPLKPESDDEEIKKAEAAGHPGEKEDEAAAGKEEGIRVRIDFAGLDQRILALDVPARVYSDLSVGESGVLFYMENVSDQPTLRLNRYDLAKREAKPFMNGLSDYRVSSDGKQILYSANRAFGIVAAQGEHKPGDGRIQTGNLRMRVDPVAEWRQIYREGWRINRDFFYDAEMHGADWPAVYDKYLPFVDFVAHRSDLSYILANLIGELTCGHSRAGGGELPPVQDVPRVSGGFLGADYAVENNLYRIKKIYTGENWNPELRAPLTEPGLSIQAGDYLLEVNGAAVKGTDNLHRFFEGTAEKQIVLRINDKPAREGSRLVTVVPVRSEYALRQRAWIENSRRKVDEMSGGKLAYVWLPNTSYAGYVNFNRYYYAQMDKEGAVIDERFNGGGSVADYFVDLMDRPRMNYFATRDGKPITSPMAQIFGPKVMIINEYAGSGGDALPYYFRFRKIGPLIGKRTWGGLVGHHGGMGLIDGGAISSPNLAFYNLDGEWDVENKGIAPDIEVEMTPALVIQGHDPQLERAVQEALRLLEDHAVKPVPRPAPIDRVSKKK